MRAMGRFVLSALLGIAILTNVSVASADEGYFSDGKKQLTFKEAGSRSETERITLYSLFGAGLLAGAVGTFYVLDSRSQSDKVSANGYHTGQTWTADLEATRTDALRSRKVAQVSLGLSTGFLLAGIVTYIITEPEMEVGYQDWQTRSFAKPTRGGVVLGQGWSF
jgi:hypothetical protein